MATKQDRPAGGTDVFEILRHDHQVVTGLMNQLKNAGSSQQKQQLFQQLQSELELHMSLEERFFYPVLENIDELADMVQDALADHDNMREIMQDMTGQNFDSEDWQTNCQALEDTKEDHVDLEEQEVFPQALELVDPQELRSIGERIATEKSSAAEGGTARQPRKGPPRAHA